MPSFFNKILVLSTAVLYISIGNPACGQYAGSKDRVRENPNRVGNHLYHSNKLIRSVVRGDQPPPPDLDGLIFDDPEETHPPTYLDTRWDTFTTTRREYSDKKHPCEQSSCYPATGNLLIGRESQLAASSTCGLYKPQRFCIVSHLEDRKKCFWCDSRVHTANKPETNHLISNIVYKVFPGTRQKSWWQSENGKENVTIQLDLEAEFHFTHMIIVFKTFRPAAMFIERSYDFGKTWQVYRFFAANCEESFPGVREGPIHNLTDVVCESRYSSVEPSTDGEFIFRVLPPNMQIDSPYSEQVQNLLKMTNLRINFTKLHTLGDDLLDRREEIQEKYYYAISNMVVRGSCSCYGHAHECLPLPGIEPKTDMVHGRCKCTHNTKGRNCEECEDFFNDLPWRPAIGKQTNACQICNCNNHATSCHFDAAVYESTGRVSGGVCDGCKHNTMGPNCEQCKPFFYRDPNRNIQDPEVCRPCDCDPIGSLDDGICDSLTDSSNSLEAGACHCKKNVEGRRCDSCKNGFWSFDIHNPEGCQPCTCNTLGTINNQGCDVYTGDCICKRYVTGRDCNQCLPEYWGLSNKRDGCQPCDCDPGGSLDNNCDVITGQCRCKDNIQGRTCNQPKQYFFTGSIDFLVYEAEIARASPTCQVVIREPYRDGRDNTWTGIGFMRAFENSFIEFTIDDIQKAMKYDIVVRYEDHLPRDWDNAVITIERSERVDPNGPCANVPPGDEVIPISFSPGSRSVTVYPPVCLEPNKSYKVRLTFNQYSFNEDKPTASILVDSIMLNPRIESIPFFHGSLVAENRRQEYERYQCNQKFNSVHKEPIPDVCKKYFTSISYHTFEKAYPCLCNTTGSKSKLCVEFGGRCQCKLNVVGRRCDRCAPDTYGFGPEGCTVCDCNSIGALDNFCDITTGQCKCRPNTYGRECNQCQPGFWNFPNCQRCECNGHADVCDSRNGMCTNCRDFTEGPNCEKCIQGYYGDPRLGFDIPCRPCPCPGIAGSGLSYADRCMLDPHTKDVVCECQEGYAGSRCDVCADNYYGNPEKPGGSCQSCNCSNKIDITRPGNCDPHTGKCLQCLFDTEGDHCEVCRAGYFRVDEDGPCIECVCDILGTNQTAGPCDRHSGQCQCLKNVVGKNCDSCLENHWKIASGEGCEPCNCDPVGSLAPQCNQYDGQCKCKPRFGGRGCNECQAYHWGDPNQECFSCDCNEEGSETLQCARNNGSCICMLGIGGEKCDVCARGYLGDAPECSPCGECFDNWDRILNERKQQTLDLIEKAKNMNTVGATGSYSLEFKDMELQLDEVKALLDNTTISLDDIKNIKDTHIKLNASLKADLKKLKDIEDNIINKATQDINLKNIALDDLQIKEGSLKNLTNQLKENATRLQEANVRGAFGLIQEAMEKAAQANATAEDAKKIVDDAERQCKGTELLVNRTSSDFLESNKANNNTMEELKNTLDELVSFIPGMNNKICDKYGDPCDDLCGGAKCGFCGGVSCELGAVKKSEKALAASKDANEILKKKELEADNSLRVTTQVKSEVDSAKKAAQEAFDEASKVNNQSNSLLQTRNTKIADFQTFLTSNEAKPSEVLELAKKTLNMKIELEPEQITNLSNKIQNTLLSLKNIEAIIEETAPSLEKANNLMNSAEDAKKNSIEILNSVNRIHETLVEAKTTQDMAETAINKAKSDISTAENDLAEIGSESSQAQTKANETESKVEILQMNLKRLQENNLRNNLSATEVGNSVKMTEEQAIQSEAQARNLTTMYENVNKTLMEKSKRSYSSRDRANKLLQRALQLTVKTSGKLVELEEIQKAHYNDEKELKQLSDNIDTLNDKMKQYLKALNDTVVWFEIC